MAHLGVILYAVDQPKTSEEAGPLGVPRMAFLLSLLVPGWRQSIALVAVLSLAVAGGYTAWRIESGKAALAETREAQAKNDLADALEVNRQNLATLDRIKAKAEKTDRIVADLRASQDKAEVALRVARDQSITAPDAKDVVGEAIDMALDGINSTRGNQ